MDLTFRKAPVCKFFEALHFVYCDNVEDYIETKNGAVVVEDLKLFHDEEWNIIESKLSLKPIQKRKLEHAVATLRGTGKYEEQINPPSYETTRWCS